MKKLQTLFSFIFTKTFYHKAISYWLLIVFIYFLFLKDLALVFFLTFIFSYLFYSSAKFLEVNIYKFLENRISEEKLLKIKRFLSINFIITLEYIIFITVIILIISKAIPKIQSELTWLSNNIPFLKGQIENIKNTLETIKSNYTQIDSSLKNAFSKQNYEILINIFLKIKSAWAIILEFILSVILSYIFLLDRKNLKKYLFWIKKSSFKFLYEEYKVIFDKIIRSFWLILKAQSMIAFINAVLTSIWLFIIGSVFFHDWWFPYLLTLGVIVFIFWFIPVLWTFLSSIPILIVAYTFSHSLILILAIILLIAIVHTIEAYILNPKIFSNFLELPVSLTFIILIVWEKLFWVAWLLIWVSLFYFIAELLRDIDEAIKKKHKIRKIEKKLLKRVKAEN